MKNALTLKQQRFVDEYLVDGNSTRAAAAAGYSARTAYSIGQENLKKPEIHLALETRRQALAEKVELRQTEVVKEMKLLALSSVDHYRIDDYGNVTVAPDVPPEAMRAISSIKRRVIHRQTEKEKTVTYQTELKLWDKPSMVQTAGRYLHLFDEKDQTTTINNNYLVFLDSLKALGRKLEVLEGEFTRQGRGENASAMAQEVIKKYLTGLVGSSL